jgi:hypothetical protein
MGEGCREGTFLRPALPSLKSRHSHRHHRTHKRNSNAVSDKNGCTLVQQISDILASTKADKIKAQHVAYKLGREWGNINGSIRRFAPFRDMLADTGFEYVHRIGPLGSCFVRTRG